MKDKICIDVFSGAGGMSVGASMAGFETNYAIEYDKDIASTFDFNHPNTVVINKDIRDVKTSQFPSRPFIIFGGPPCQGFSTSNMRTRNLDNEKNWMFKEYFRFVSDLKPEWFIFENVKGFADFQQGKFAKMVEKEFNDLGYTVSSDVLCASDYGVPQKRKRYFMIGNRKGKKFDFGAIEKTKSISVEEALSDLPKLYNGCKEIKLDYASAAKSSYQLSMRNRTKFATQNFVSKNKLETIKKYKYIKQGENWTSIPEKLLASYKNKKNIHGGIYRRLSLKEPSSVIANYRKSMLIHPTEDRGLSVREAARLQSFPDDFEFKGTLSSMQQQVGNAVPPILSEQIFKTIYSYL